MGLLNLLLVNLALVVAAHAICHRGIPDLLLKISGSRIAFTCNDAKEIFLSTGRYVPKNVLATRIRFYKDILYVALPRYKHGAPITLAYVDLKQKGCNAVLQPYPCWSIQEEGNCDALQSVSDIYLDANEILWALDTGIVNTLEQPVRRCAPKLVGISVKTNQVVKVIDLSNLITPKSNLQQVVVDFDCDGRTYAYISDGGSGAIIVYNISDGKGYRVVLPKIAVAGYYGDILHIALIQRPDCNRIYFSYAASSRLYYVKTIFLQKGQAAGAIIDVGPKPPGSELIILGSDAGYLLFFRYKGSGDIYVWNTNSCFKPDNFLLVQRGDDCRLSTHVVPGFKKLMWLIESNFNDYIANTDGCLGPSIVIHPLIKACN